MLQRYLLSVSFILIAFHSNASHLMGGELSVQVDSNNRAYFHLKLYRDAGGAGLSNSSSINIITPSGSSMTHSLSRDSVVSITTTYPVEEHHYSGSLQLNQYGSFTASYSTCCRNFSVQNIVNAGSHSFYIKTDFTSYMAQTNSTPVFLNKPVVLFPLDTLWAYNPLPFDAEGDSLYWRIDTPMSAATTYVPYSSPAADPNGPLAIDPFSGV